MFLFYYWAKVVIYNHIWHVSNRDYDNIIGLKVIAYNLMVISNIELGDSRREIMKIVSC